MQERKVLIIYPGALITILHRMDGQNTVIAEAGPGLLTTGVVEEAAIRQREDRVLPTTSPEVVVHQNGDRVLPTTSPEVVVHQNGDRVLPTTSPEVAVHQNGDRILLLIGRVVEKYGRDRLRARLGVGTEGQDHEDEKARLGVGGTRL